MKIKLIPKDSTDLGTVNPTGPQFLEQTCIQIDPSGGEESGNTKTLSPTAKKQISPAKHWVFTLNNPNHPTDWDRIISSESSRIPTLVVQEEIGAGGNHHYQGACSFADKCRPFNAFGKNMERIHWEKANALQASRAYCCKIETRKDGTNPYIRGWRMPFKIDITLRKWQQGIIDILNGPVHDRTVYHFYDEAGGIGKTILQKYIYTTMKGVVIVGGKATDMKHGIAKYVETHGDTPQIVLINIPRSIEQYVSYDGIESAKDMFMFSPKYEGAMICGHSPHVICFSNAPPDRSKMSEDRWHVVDLGEGDN